MIDLNLYRFRIGSFVPIPKNHKPGKTYKTNNCGTDLKFLNINAKLF